MTTTSKSSKPTRIPWIIAGVLGCLAVCLLVVLIVEIPYFLRSESGTTHLSQGVPTPATPTSTRVRTTLLPPESPRSTVNQPTQTASPTLTQAASRDATVIVTRGIAALTTLAYRATVTQAAGTAILEFALPDRYRVSQSGTPLYLFIGATFYSQSQGRWSKPGDVFGMTYKASIIKSTGYTDQITEARQVGTETLNGVPTQIFSYTGRFNLRKLSPNASDELSDPFVYRMWIGADGSPRKIDFNHGEMTSTIQYDPSIQIQAPPL